MTHWIFVYGTLKRGYYNHRFLKEAEFVCTAFTEDRYLMWDVGFPLIAPPRDSDSGDVRGHVAGEVYVVDDATLEVLDRLEGHPRNYKRTPIFVVGEVDSKGTPVGEGRIDVQAYIWQRVPIGEPVHPVNDTLEWKGDHA
jgi:gamma-glutamylcyclotransferase (GGCT)/AIG2-like uncharacterized protein YtfP